MNSSIAVTICRLLAPQHNVSISWFVWRRLVAALVERGHKFSRESGAFLLGYPYEGRVRIVDFVLYDDIDPRCLDTGIVTFDGRHFSALWALCKERGLSVVADVHTHMGSEAQSRSDQQHPMVATAGHIAFILPRFAARPMSVANVGMYRYCGSKRWDTVSADSRSQFLFIGI
jgi:hypothetical protein